MSNSHAQIISAAIYAQAHLDEELNLSFLASIANMSSHHFHRNFVKETGETPAKFVQRLRVEKAAFRLQLHKDSIISIALDCGFTNPETLSRAFKRQLGITPGEYRKNKRLGIPLRREFQHNRVTTPTNSSCVEFKLSTTKTIQMQNTDIAFIHLLGPYEDVDCSIWDELDQWADLCHIPKERAYMGIAHDIPNLTPPEKLRFDACISIPSTISGTKRVRIGQLQSHHYAMTTHIGSYQTLPTAYPLIFAHSSSLSGWEIAVLPIIEIYRDNCMDSLRAISTTDIYIPLRPASPTF